MFKSRKFLQGAIDVLLLAALAIGLGLILENGSLLPQSPKVQILYPPLTSGNTLQPELPTQEDNRLTPYPPPEEGSKDQTPVAVTAEAPPCTFPGAEETNFLGSLQDYVFSEPKILPFLHGGYKVVEWLPDNDHILVTQRTSRRDERIELFNVSEGISQTVAERALLHYDLPVWWETPGVVIYPDKEIPDRNKPTDFTRQLNISQDNPKSKELLTRDIQEFSLTAKPGGDQVAYRSSEQILVIGADRNVLKRLDFKPAAFGIKENGTSNDGDYSMAWRPGTDQILIYSDGDNGGRTLLLDTVTKQICSLNLDGWAGVVRWNPNGRYLAVLRARDSYPINTSDLAVLDMTSGRLYTMQVIPPRGGIYHYLRDLAWVADNQYLAIIGEIMDPYNQDADGKFYQERRLYIVDYFHDQTIEIFPDREFFTGWWGQHMISSPDGASLLAPCRDIPITHYCLVSIRRKSQ